MFKPNVTVATVVTANNKYLLVEETVNGKTVFNQPAGHLEADENLIQGAQRELREETGLDLAPQHLLGVYLYPVANEGLHFLRFCFLVELDECLHSTPQDKDIIACHWFSLDQIRQMQSQLRSPMVLNCIEDAISGTKLPLSALKSY